MDRAPTCALDAEGNTVASLGSGAMDWTQGVLLKSVQVEEGFDLKALVFLAWAPAVMW